jgi:hypothetical protein
MKFKDHSTDYIAYIGSDAINDYIKNTTLTATDEKLIDDTSGTGGLLKKVIEASTLGEIDDSANIKDEVDKKKIIFDEIQKCAADVKKYIDEASMDFNENAKDKQYITCNYNYKGKYVDDNKAPR